MSVLISVQPGPSKKCVTEVNCLLRETVIFQDCFYKVLVLAAKGEPRQTITGGAESGFLILEIKASFSSKGL